MVTHSMENILNMQYYAPVNDEALHSPPSRKKRCLSKEQDPMSHRIIEKRRRDRMNNCLADLSRLIPAEYLKKGRGRVEKTEIIEMAIRHMKYLQGLRQDSKHHTPVVHHTEDSVDSVSHPSPPSSTNAAEHYRLGYQECLSETMHFLVEVEGFFARDALCVQLISHLQQHCDKILASCDRLGFPHPVDLATSNGTSCTSNGLGAFSQANGGLPAACPTNGVNGNGLGLLNGVNNNNNNNNNNVSSSNNNNNNNNTSNHNLNGVGNGNGYQSHGLLHSSSNSSSDRCSSSGVSSYDPSESRPSQRVLIPPPTLTSDDSNHSSHSHGSGSLPGSASSHHHHHHHHHQYPQQQHLSDAIQRPASTYKFKNSIKQRFSADQRTKSSSCSPPPHAAGSPTESRNGQQLSEPQQHPNQQQQQQQQQQQGVPIFALHDNGGFYIPLTVEASVLRPQLGYADAGSETVLHPVTISVNFNHSPTTNTSSATWSSHPSPSHHPSQ